jgi:glycosyltransferase involved in cell wall biosynthesis
VSSSARTSTTVDEPFVSVVTPFYNTAEYLAECIESVLAQTHGNFEYVLLDNCSTDGSTEIAERYARRDPRIRLLRNERLLPQMANFNEALRQISPDSRYCKLILADDALLPRCLTEMVALAEAHPSVSVVSSYYLAGDDPRPHGLRRETVVMSGREACRLHLIDGIFLFGSPSVVMYRSDLVRSRAPFFGETWFHEDTKAMYEIMRDHDLGFVHQILTFMRVQADSVTGSTRSYVPKHLDKYILYRRYGHEHLSPEELRRYAGEHERLYRRFLAESWLRRREPGFWKYHRAGLATIGERIDRATLARDALPLLFHYLFSPEVVARAVGRRLGRLLRGRDRSDGAGRQPEPAAGASPATAAAPSEERPKIRSN